MLWYVLFDDLWKVIYMLSRTNYESLANTWMHVSKKDQSKHKSKHRESNAFKNYKYS